MLILVVKETILHLLIHLAAPPAKSRVERVENLNVANLGIFKAFFR
jgi:hypothetical protein